MTMETKISSLALYDDLCRSANVLTDANDEEMYKLVSAMEDWRKRESASELEFQRLNELYKKAIAEKSALEANLIHARSAIEMEMKRRIAAEQERDVMEHQIALIRELLANDQNGLNDGTREKLAFLQSTYNLTGKQDSQRRLDTINESSGSILSSEDISYDRTDDNIDDSNGNHGQRDKRVSGRLSAPEGKRRPSAPPMKELTPPKRSKISHSIESTVLTDIVDKTSEGRRRTSESRQQINKSFSEPSTNLYPEDQDRLTVRQDVEDPVVMSMGIKSITTPDLHSRYTPGRQYLSGSKLNNRRHDFCTKTIIKPETCTPCGKKISFGKSAFRCKDCRTVCHLECKDKVPLPCVPTVYTPSSKGISKAVIADYAPLTSPMIPAIVIHCINEIEARGLKEVGIYRVPGSEREVKDLKEKFLRGKGVPNLSRIDDIHSVCGCLKDFLRSLKEPLIVNSKWHDFVNSAESIDLNPMYNAISELPTANCDTLAFLILHLQKVADSPACRMSASNLAKIFGPTIVGYSSLDPEPAMMLAETRKQAIVMERLLSIPSDYWKKIIEVDNSSSDLPDTQNVNERRQSYGKGKLVATPLGPRDATRRMKNQRKSMTFSSPMVIGTNY